MRVNIELEREADRPFIVNGTVRPVEPLLPTENSVYDGLGRQRGDQTVQTLRGSLSRAKALFDEDAGLESVSFSGSVRDGFSVVEKRNGVTRQVLSATNNEVVGPTQLDPAAAAGVLPRAEAAVIAGMVRDTILAKFERELVKDFSAADLKGREEVYVGVGINSLGLDYLSAILYEPGGAGNGGLGATFGRGQGGPPKFSFGGTGVRGSQSRAVTDAEKAAFTRLDEDLLGVPSLDLTREAKRRLDYVFRRRPGGQYDVQSVQFVDGNTADEIARYDFVERPAPFSPAVVKDSKRLARQAASVARRRERDYGQFLAPNGPSRPSLADATALRVSLIGESTLPSVVALADAGDALYAGDLLVETTPSLRELSARGIDELVFKYTRPDGRYELQSITAVRAGGGTEEIFSSADAVKYERFPGTRTN